MKLLPTLSSEVPLAPRVVSVSAGDSHYDAFVGTDLLRTIGARAASLFRGARCAVVADTNSAALFAEQVFESLQAANIRAELITIPAGENSKTLEQAGQICGEMQRAGLDRSSFLIALGGGVVGDLAGFAAAIYHRGIRYVQAPTTLLAQVDSAIGGKTGVNTDAGKNLLGAVHQPALVLADLDTLQTLTPREFKQGFAEIIKHGIIADAALLDGAHELRDLVARNIELKAAIVAHDEKDISGARAILNFGHTVGHAIEKTAGYGAVLHGEAISLGMVVACDVSVRKAGLTEAEREKVIRTLQEFHLPTKMPNELSRDAILTALHSDKKFERGEIRFVITPQLGSARLTSDITLADIEQALASL